MANYNQNWNDQMGGNYYGFGNNNQGIASPNLVPLHMQKYFSDRNQMVYPGADRNIHEGFGTADVSSTFPPPANTNTFMDTLKGFKGPVLSVLEKLKYTRPEAKQTAYDAITSSVNPETGRGMYKGNEYRLEGNKIYSELNPQGLNFDSGFGSKSVEEMDQKKLDWAQKRLEEGKGLSQRLRNILIQRGLYKKPTNIDLTKIQDPGTGGAPVDTNAGGAPVTTGGGGTFNPAMDEKGRLNTSNTWHGATRAREQAFRDTGGKQGQVAGPGGGSGAYWAKGGRVGYRDGEFVDEDINIEGPGFDVNENMEMAEKTPFEMRIDELMDTGMSWQEAYDIASDEFNQLAEGPEDSFSEEGIASLV